MKPIAIFRHVAHEGPGYFSDFLERNEVPWQLIRIDEGDALPEDATQFSGLVFMGGPMSVNDELPWIVQELALIRQAVGRDIPVLGHCLGGQLIAKALGGVVVRNPVKEIGWGEVMVTDNDVARDWLDEVRSFDGFHWHGETFSLPVGAVNILSSRYCANQGFAFGKHLALQCHVEMTDELISSWCEHGAGELAASAGSPAVQSAATMQEQAVVKLPQLHAVASQLYTSWIAGLQH